MSQGREALKDRIAAYRRSGDARVLLEDRALVEVIVLRAAQGWPTSGPLPAGTDLRGGIDAAVTAGTFLWLRSQVLPEADRIDPLLEAVDLLTTVRDIAPRSVPRAVGRALTAMTGGTRKPDHASVHDTAIGVLTSDEARGGELASVDHAIVLLSSAARSAAGDAREPYYLSDLGSAWLDRFRITGRGRDLENALGVHERALGGAVAGVAGVAGVAEPEDRAGLLANYSGALLAMFEHDGDGEVLERAVMAAREATDLARSAGRPAPGVTVTGAGRSPGVAAPAGTGDAAGPTAGAGGAGLAAGTGGAGLAGDAQRGNEPDTGSAGAISAPELSGPMPVVPVLSGERGAAIRMAQLASLSRLRAALLASYERNDREVDLDEAVQVAREAVSLVPAGDPAHADYQAQLAHLLRLQAERRGRPAGRHRLADVPPQGGPGDPGTVPTEPMEMPWQRS